MSEIQTWAFWRAVLAEFLGMVIFIFIGISAAIGDKNNTYPDQEIKVASAFGLAIATLVQSLGHISGAHLNPAVTLGLLASCQTSICRAFFYIIAQVLGSLAGSAIVYGIRPPGIESLGVNKLNGISPSQGFGIEFLLTLQLVLCVLAVTDKRRDVGGFAPLSIGLSVGLGHLAGISYTGCGINPARSFGPAVIERAFDDQWVYWAGPLSAAVVAAPLYHHALAPKGEALGTKKKALLQGSAAEGDAQEPLLEDSGWILCSPDVHTRPWRPPEPCTHLVGRQIRVLGSVALHPGSERCRDWIASQRIPRCKSGQGSRKVNEHSDHAVSVSQGFQTPRTLRKNIFFCKRVRHYRTSLELIH